MFTRARPGKAVLIAGAVVAVLVVTVGVALTVARSALPDAGHLSRTLNEFPAPASWSGPEVSAEPARLVCLGGNPCPSTVYSWTVPATTTLEDFIAVLDASGWALGRSEGCTQPPPASGARGCLARGEVDGVKVYVSYSSTRPEGQGEGAVVVGASYP